VTIRSLVLSCDKTVQTTQKQEQAGEGG